MSGQVNGTLGRARAQRWGNWMYMGVAGHHLHSLGWIVGGGIDEKRVWKGNAWANRGNQIMMGF